MKIAYSFGFVDFLHIGHIQMMRRAKANADMHVFGLIGDKTAGRWQGAMVSTFAERKTVLEALNCIDLVMEQEAFDPAENLKKLHKRYPDAEITLFHRADWQALPADTYVRSIGGRVELADYYAQFTPENILKTLQAEAEIPDFSYGNDLISTKANTLLALQPLVKKSKIETIYVIVAEAFYDHQESVAEEITKRFEGKKIVVRSSSSGEDCYEYSNAGHFKSILDVDSGDNAAVVDAICQVFASYGAVQEARGDEQVLVQIQTLNVAVSGVVFTRDIKANRPYYVINYDDSGSTDSVTGGSGGKTLWISHDMELAEVAHPWRALIESVQEIEGLLTGITLDIEFAITGGGEIVIFQVRPLAANYRFSRKTNDEEYFALKRRAKTAYANIPNTAGEDTIKLSDMAFWNPAEMIGSNPRCLDYSLYRYLITYSAWNDGLTPMGYTPVREELMYKIGNKPYISLDYSFKALTPAGISDRLMCKLLRYYRKKLRSDLSAHDKIEFEIVLNCYDFCSRQRLNELPADEFDEQDKQELGKALYDLTHDCIHRYFDDLKKDREDIVRLSEIRKDIGRDMPFFYQDSRQIINGFKTLISSIERYGTPQFSRQARYAFIASSLCRSLAACGFWTEDEKSAFLMSVNTVAKTLETSLRALREGSMSRREFDREFGHLRSGTYDIRTERYEHLSFGTQDSESALPGTDDSLVYFKSAYADGIAMALKETDLGVSAEDLMAFLRSAVEQREWFKFEFTKALSDALELLIALAQCLGIPRKDMSYLEMPDIFASTFYTAKDDLKRFFETIIAQRKEEYQKNSALLLPDVIWEPRDLDMVSISEARPNFITVKRVSGEVGILEGNANIDIRDKIVVIEKADPGYDWIFSRGIKGLITKYGGVASHMAIRCAEFDLPAAIGCGEKIFSFVVNTRFVTLDCKNGKLTEEQ